MAQWEELKCKVDTLSKSYNLRLPAKIQQIISLSSVHIPSYNQVTGMFRLTADSIKEIFSPVLNQIAELIQGQITMMKESTGCSFDYIFVVGGFGDSKLLHTTISEQFKSQVNKSIVIPLRAGEAIIDGAIILASDSSLISSRRARMTFGVKGIKPFEAPWTDITKKKKFPGMNGDWCDGCFDKYVTVGEEFVIDSEVVHDFKPTHANQTEMKLEVYQTPTKNPIYVTEQGCRKLGDMIIDMNDTGEGLDRIVRLSMKFGDVEIKLKAMEVVSKQEYNAVIKYDGDTWTYNG